MSSLEDLNEECTKIRNLLVEDSKRIENATNIIENMKKVLKDQAKYHESVRKRMGESRRDTRPEGSAEYRPGCVYCVLKGQELEKVLDLYSNDEEVLGQMAVARGMPELLDLARERRSKV